MDVVRRRQVGGGVAPVAAVSLAQQIETLDELWRRGVINDTEFQSLRSGLLGHG
jgi:hypothetical protein